MLGGTVTEEVLGPKLEIKRKHNGYYEHLLQRTDVVFQNLSREQQRHLLGTTLERHSQPNQKHNWKISNLRQSRVRRGRLIPCTHAKHPKQH